MTTTTYDRNATLTAAWNRGSLSSSAPTDFKNIMDHSPKTTAAPATEGLHVFTPSIISSLFSKLNGALAVAIEAERDITHIDVWDPAVDAWLREAERAWRTVTDIQTALRDAPVLHASDAPLLAMLDQTVALMATDTTHDFIVAHDRLRLCAFFRRAAEPGQMPDHVSAMLDRCHAHLSAVAQMDLFQPVCDPEDLPYGLSEAWPEAC